MKILARAAAKGKLMVIPLWLLHGYYKIHCGKESKFV